MFKMLIMFSPLVLRTCSFSSSRVIEHMNQTKSKLLCKLLYHKCYSYSLTFIVILLISLYSNFVSERKHFTWKLTYYFAKDVSKFEILKCLR